MDDEARYRWTDSARAAALSILVSSRRKSAPVKTTPARHSLSPLHTRRTFN